MTNPPQYFRIETSAGRARFFDSEGNQVGGTVFSFDLHQTVDQPATLELRQYLTQAVVEGEAVVERVTICPDCRKAVPPPVTQQTFYLTRVSDGFTLEIDKPELLRFAKSLAPADSWLISTAKPK